MNKRDGKKRVLFVCNAGGHLSEMMKLSSLFPRYNSMLLTENHITARKIDASVPVRYMNMNAFRQKRGNLVKTVAYLMMNFFHALYIYLSFRPSVIVTTGANMALIICYIGKLFNTKIVFIEITAKVTAKTKTGKLLEPIADLIIVQWPEMLNIYKKSVYWGITF